MRERIKQLAAEFLQRCSRDVMSLRALAARLGVGNSHVFDATLLKELEQLAHRICGTGASLGFESLSTRAAAIERLAEGQTGGVTAGQNVVERLAGYITALEIEVDRLIHPSV